MALLTFIPWAVLHLSSGTAGRLVESVRAVGRTAQKFRRCLAAATKRDLSASFSEMRRSYANAERDPLRLEREVRRLESERRRIGHDPTTGSSALTAARWR